MNILDGLDDDFEVAARKPRPLYTSLEELQRMVFTNDSEGAARALNSVRTSAGDSLDNWGTISIQVAALASALASGNYLDAFSSDIALTLFRTVDEDEAEGTKPDSFSTLVTMFRWRLQRFVVQGEGDAYADGEGSIDTLVHYRAAAVVFLAAAALNAYVQGNYTGPEFPEAQLDQFSPLPYMRSLLGLPEWEPASKPAWHPTTAAETRIGQAGLSVSLLSTGPAATDALVAAAAGVAARSPLAAASLSALQVGSDDAYEHIAVPHWLVTARVLLTALLGPADTSSATERAHAKGALAAEPKPPAPAAGGVDADVRFARLHAAGRAIPGASWWGARSAVLHQRSMVEREPSLLLWREAALRFRCAARALCPGYLPAFGTADVFMRDFVAAEFEATAAVDVDRRALSGAPRAGEEEAPPIIEDEDGNGASGKGGAPPATSAGANAAASPARAPPSPVVARLLLEWGNAQHFFGRASAAKTAFFLARRETGLRTRLTGVLGRRTKFQKFDISQLVLHARSEGVQAAAAAADAARAEQLGAAPGRYSAAALRGDEPEPTPAVEAAAPATEDAAPVPAAAAASTDAPAASTDAPAAPAGEDGAAPAAPVNELAPDAPLPVDERITAAPMLLGGVRSMRLDQVDSDNILLEEVRLRPAELAGVVTEEDLQREQDAYGRLGWGKEIEARLATAAAAQAAAAGGAAPAPIEGTTTDASTTSSTASQSAAAPLQDGPLSALDQAIVLALCLDIRNHNPEDGLTAEEMRPYVDRVLDTPLNWMVYSSGLLVRSWLEFESHRTQERAVLQMQALVDQHSNRLTPMQASQKAIDESAPAGDRMAYVHCLAFPPRWELKRQCADRYRKLGVLRSALQLYEELETWDDIIDTCVALDKRARAEALVRARLEVRSTPRLWCVLGVVMDSDEHILTGWELSKHTYARAQLLLAKRLAARNLKEEAVRALAKGLSLAPHSSPDWFLLGMLCMQLKKLGTAAEAFTKCVQADPTNANAWANLGSIYLHAKEWAKGYSALEQALRIDRTDWRMSSNFLVAAIRTRNYSRAITVFRRLLDARHSDERNEGLDVPCLGVLTQAVLGSARAEAEEARRAAGEVTGRGKEDGGSSSGSGSGGWGDDSASGGGGVLPSIPESLEMLDEEEEEQEEGGGKGASAGAAKAGDASGAAPGPGEPDLKAQMQFDAAGNPASIYLDALTSLYEHITSSITKEPKVWQMFAQLRDARGEADEALECRLRMCRALQTAHWERQEAAVVALCRASRELTRDYLRHGTPAHLLSARMHLQTVIGKADAGRLHGKHAEVGVLRGLLEDVTAREAAAANGAGAGAGDEKPVPAGSQTAAAGRSVPTRAFHSSN